MKKVLLLCSGALSRPSASHSVIQPTHKIIIVSCSFKPNEPMRTLLSIAFLALLISFSAFGQNYCEIQSIQYDVINDCGHSVGSEWWLNDDVGGWAAFVDSDDAGFLTYGPFDNSGISGLRQVTYNLLVADNNSNNLVFTIDVWDATAGEQLSVQDVYQDWFSAGITPQSFTL
jgi:hypothetical protein